MGRKYFFYVAFLLSSIPALAQTYGNEWISYSQKYFRIFVTQDGVYRIDSLTLAKAGVPLNSINPKNIQIFDRGKEEYIFIRGEADGKFNSTDTLEFYGHANDGSPDSALYNGAPLPNPYVSLFNDTAIYYLTWNQSLNNHRMIPANDSIFTGFSPAPFMYKEDVYATLGDYFQGTTDINNITDPEYLPMESVVNPPVSFGQSVIAYMNTANAYTTGPPAVMRTRLLTRSNDFNVNKDTHLQLKFAGNAFDTLVDGYMTFPYTAAFPAASLSAVTQVELSSINPGSSANSGDAATSFVAIKYPHTMDLEGASAFKMTVPVNGPPGKSYLVFTDFNNQGSTARFYDLTYHRRVRVVASGSNLQVILSDSLKADKSCYITSDNGLIPVTGLQPVNGNGMFTNFKQESTDSAYVIVTNAMLWYSASAYKQYRSSVQGGSNHVVLADINELYDQFGFGVRMGPLAVRNFCGYLIHAYPSKPKSLFLIGKSFNQNFQRYSSQPGMMLPTFGYPASDNLFTAKLGTTSYAPTLATGRIVAESNADVMVYLNKVSAYEQNAAAPWMKQVLHFGGGNGSAEQNLFKAYLNKYANIIQADTNYGGHVTSFYKTSTAPIQINQSDSLKQIVNNGVSIMTFFGHASGSGFDVSIDDPSNYHNAPRLPLVIANSCLAGDIHSTGPPSTSQKFITGPTGAIAFIASTTLGLVGELDPYSTGLYRSIAKYNYGKGVGQHIQYTFHQREKQNGGFSLYAKSTFLCMTLDGDPGVVIASPHLPDYAIAASDLSFDTHTRPDSVYVTAVMHNNGKAVIDSFVVKLQRRYANGDTDSYRKTVVAPAYMDSVIFHIPVDFNRGIGLNKVAVTLDYLNRMKEITKVNNVTGEVDLLIQGSSILPVWPYNDAIYPYDTVTLKASTANPLDIPRDYRIQIDTTDTYNSPYMKSIVLKSKPGGVITWKPPIAHLTDSVVYYWRVTPDTVGTTNKSRWKESSFQYITGKRGWEQAHFFQFKNDQYQFVKFNRTKRRYDFVNDVKSIEINNAVMGVNGHDWPDVNYKINSVTLEESSWAINGFSFAVINPRSLNPWVIDTNCSPSFVGYDDPRIGNTVGNCGQRFYAYDFYDSTAARQAKMANFLASVPVGYYLIAWTNSFTNNWGGAGAGFDTVNSYSVALKQQFASFGSSQITPASTPLNTHSAYIMLGKKGWSPGQAIEKVSPDEMTKITLTDTLTTNWQNGFIASEVIGPAKSWDEFHIRKTHLETPSYDSLVIRVIGITANGTQVTLANLKDTTRDMYNLASLVNANTYPFIRLYAYMADDTNRTPPQLKRWQVIYTQAPEMAVNPAIAFSFKKDTVQEGQPLVVSCAVQNISDLNFTDSLQINYWLLDKNHIKHSILLPNNKSYKVRKPPFNANTYFIDTVSVNTTGYPGLNSFWMEANPLSTPRTEKEEYHFNNLLERPFFVTTDRTNPLMDVTFDGVHILDGDIISAKPNILISLKDENMFLALNDTADFKLFLQYPNTTALLPVYFRNNITFTPAVLPKNSCRLNYTPVLTADGIYTLVVQAKDRSNNSSGSINYQITFDVINHSMITDVMNYPNPFTTATHFVFTITGSEVPTTFRIQIMTITGKLVREIERDELGPLHIGRNMTEYAWDGRDQFGDRLATGVYFYRVLTKINSENIEHMDSGADEYFKKGFGKMYLMK